MLSRRSVVAVALALGSTVVVSARSARIGDEITGLAGRSAAEPHSRARMTLIVNRALPTLGPLTPDRFAGPLISQHRRTQ
jgi:hypothetical protein